MFSERRGFKGFCHQIIDIFSFGLSSLGVIETSAHRFFKIVKILNTKFQHTSTIDIYCVENQVCVVLGARTHWISGPKGPET
jgi:hypothetical protein